VLRMDNRGAGNSDKPAGPYSISQLADDAYAVIRQQGTGPAHIVGTSMGGYIALTLAIQHPEAVQSLILLATTCGGTGAHAVPPQTLAAWAAAVPLGRDGFARATMPLSFRPGWVNDHPAEFDELLAHRLAAPTPTESWRAQFAACAQFLRDGLPPARIEQPSLIIHGTADRIVPYQNAAHLARRLPQADVVTLKGAGHLCWIEEAAAVNELIRSMIIRNR